MNLEKGIPWTDRGVLNVKQSHRLFVLVTIVATPLCGPMIMGCSPDVKVPTTQAFQGPLPPGLGTSEIAVEDSFTRYVAVVADKSRPDVDRVQAAAEITKLFESRAVNSNGEFATKAVRILRTLQQDKNDEVGMGIALAILRLQPDDDKALLALTSYLQSLDSLVREVAAYRLGTYHHNAAIVVPALTVALGDNDANIRAMAAQSLGLYGSQAASAVPSLIEALGDDDKLVRIYAAQALGDMPKEATLAVPALKKLMNSMDPDMSGAAKQALDGIEEAQKVSK
jgi:HEAT repeat protein